MEISREELQAEAADLRRLAEPIWEALKDDRENCERDQRAFESSLVHLEQQRLCITVMGEFNTGKSTLLNTFIGEDLLETDLLECTATPTWVQWKDDGSFDENRPATVVYENGDAKVMPLDAVSTYTTLNQSDWKKIERVEIALPVDDSQRTDIVLVDTPGLNGNEELEARSIHQLGMSHVTIVVVPVGGIGRETDIQLIKKARSISERVMVVINKCDDYTKTGDGFERFREDLHRRIPELPREEIYTLSAKRAFEGSGYREGEEELENEFYRFYYDLGKNVLEDPTAALQKRPLLLLQEICKEEISSIEKLEAECDTSIVKELEEVEEQLKEAGENLQRSSEEIRRLSRGMLMEEVRIFQDFLTKEQPRIEREMTRFVDELDEELLGQADSSEARKCVSRWLNKSMKKSVFDRVSSLLKAATNRLIYDLESSGQGFALNLPKMASIKLDKADRAELKKQTDKASEALSHCEGEIDGLKREEERCDLAVQKQKTKIETLERQSAQLEALEKQRKKAVKDRNQLGPRPQPKVEYYTHYKIEKKYRGGPFGAKKGIRDWLLGPKEEKVSEPRQRKDYSNVEKWERKYEAADNKVSDLDRKIKPLKAKRKEMKKIEGKLPKLQREADKARSNLRRAEARLAEEREKYRQAGIKTRQAQLKTGARRELENLFDALPDRLAQEAEEMLEGISEDFSVRFKEAADRQSKRLADEMEQRKKKAYEADAERVKRESIRKTLAEALETFCGEDQGERT